MRDPTAHSKIIAGHRARARENDSRKRDFQRGIEAAAAAELREATSSGEGTYESGLINLRQ